MEERKMSTVGKALDILEAILRNRDEVGLAALAKMTGLNRTTVHRISSILVKRGYLYQKGKGGKYSLGLKFLQYSDISNAAASIKEQALPYLQKLCDEISETVNMAILNGVEAVGIAFIATDRILQVVPGLVDRYPFHCTALGKILLAYMPDERIENIIKTKGLNAYTDNTTTDATRLKKEIATIKRDGIAFDDEEYSLGVRSAASPIKGEQGDVLAAVSFVGPSVRISKSRMIQLAPMVKNCALEISRSLGYQGE
jgi:IclR family KDG regulon transcriptional repressor